MTTQIKFNREDFLDSIYRVSNLENNVVNHYNDVDDWKTDTRQEKVKRLIENFIDEWLEEIELFEKELSRETIEELIQVIDDCEIHQRVDNQIDIYNYKLWDRAKEFQSEIEECIDEYWFNSNDQTLINAFQWGQGKAYDNAWYHLKEKIIEELKETIEELDD